MLGGLLVAALLTAAWHSVRPGAPNFEDVRKGDAPETIWVLRLAKRICVMAASPSDPPNESEGDVRQEVTVRGPLFHAHTAHHHTEVLMRVERMERASSK
jgi:hypothetical protein